MTEEIQQQVSEAIDSLALHFGIDRETLLSFEVPAITFRDSRSLPPAYDQYENSLFLFNDSSRSEIGHECSHYLHYQINPGAYRPYASRNLQELVAYWGELIFVCSNPKDCLSTLEHSLEFFARLDLLEPSAYDLGMRSLDHTFRSILKVLTEMGVEM